MKKTKDILSVDVSTDLLKQNLPKVHKARLRAVALFVLSLISEATVNLQKLALSGLTSVQPDSVCKRFSRLLIWVTCAKMDLGKLILKLTPLPQTSEFILCMDRTNWKYGKRHIQIWLGLFQTCHASASPGTRNNNRYFATHLYKYLFCSVM